MVDCDSEGLVVQAQASDAADAVCGEQKQCMCDNGTGATGTSCPVDGEPHCLACDAGHTRTSDSSACVENACTPIQLYNYVGSGANGCEEGTILTTHSASSCSVACGPGTTQTEGQLTCAFDAEEGDLVFGGPTCSMVSFYVGSVPMGPDGECPGGSFEIAGPCSRRG